MLEWTNQGGAGRTKRSRKNKKDWRNKKGRRNEQDRTDLALLQEKGQENNQEPTDLVLSQEKGQKTKSGERGYKGKDETNMKSAELEVLLIRARSTRWQES